MEYQTLVFAAGLPSSNFLFFRRGDLLPPVNRRLCQLSREIPAEKINESEQTHNKYRLYHMQTVKQRLECSRYVDQIGCCSHSILTHCVLVCRKGLVLYCACANSRAKLHNHQMGRVQCDQNCGQFLSCESSLMSAFLSTAAPL